MNTPHIMADLKRRTTEDRTSDDKHRRELETTLPNET